MKTLLKPRQWLRGGVLATMLAVVGTATAITSASAATAGCSVVPFTPRVESGYSVVATNSTACTGPVYNVRTSVKLLQYKLAWITAASSSASWGTVSVSRYGYVNAWIHPQPTAACYRYITQASVSWTYSNGSPGVQTLYSPTTTLRLGGTC
ncbi:hypothetical protein EV651_110304 [Kribbella sp. VKM Ac-2571]|uniref:hypothetical protein n=1 Tax=Kribbella sp. VKM Ac-2571 TaxID=2512222 RepID=UPI00105C62F8|nr:hypothetical protein [Kribbella sp. VKM Ac-2571]TDO58268.1 hypothetical protein EV651_110304 [Kribbella sp. VKM Ac-2571]